MTQRAPIFDKIQKDYMREVGQIEDGARLVELLGIRVDEKGYHIPFFDDTCLVNANGIVDETGSNVNHLVLVVLCQYLLLAPPKPVDDPFLVTYKDFKDAGPYVGGFANTAQVPIARNFSGKLAKLEQRGMAIGGRPFHTDVNCQLAYRFDALPRVPIHLIFHDADEDFPAQCTLLFRKDAQAYLDMECLAMVASTLAVRLREK